MRCAEFEDRLNAVLDERLGLASDPELALHVEACAICRARAHEYRALMHALDTLVPPEAPSDMAARVLAELHPVPSGRWQRVSLATAAAALAAGLLVALVPVFNDGHRAANRTGRPPLVATVPSGPIAFEQWPLVASLPELADAGGEDPYAALAKWTGQNMGEAVLMVPGVGDSDDEQPEAIDDSSAWSAGSSVLRPVTDSVVTTFYLLIQSFPSLDSSHRS